MNTRTNVESNNHRSGFRTRAASMLLGVLMAFAGTYGEASGQTPITLGEYVTVEARAYPENHAINCTDSDLYLWDCVDEVRANPFFRERDQRMSGPYFNRGAQTSLTAPRDLIRQRAYQEFLGSVPQPTVQTRPTRPLDHRAYPVVARRNAEMHWRCDTGPNALAVAIDNTRRRLLPTDEPAGWVFDGANELLATGWRARNTGLVMYWMTTPAAGDQATSAEIDIAPLADIVSDPRTDRVEVRVGPQPADIEVFRARQLRDLHRRICYAGPWNIDIPFGPYRIDPKIVPASGQPRWGNFTTAAEIGKRHGLTTLFAGGGHGRVQRDDKREGRILMYGGARVRTPYIANTMALYAEGIGGRFLPEAGAGFRSYLGIGVGLELILLIADRPVITRIGTRFGSVRCAERPEDRCAAGTTLATIGLPFGSFR